MSTKAKIAAKVRSASYDEASDRITAVISTGARVMHYDERGRPFFEELAIEEGAIDTSRVEMGAAYLIMDHEQRGLPLGRIDEVRVEGDALVADIQLIDSEQHSDVLNAIRGGLFTSLSVGYDILDTETYDDDGDTIVRVTRLLVGEVSTTPVPADPTSKFRSMAKSPGTVPGSKGYRRRSIRFNATNPKGQTMATKTATRSKATAKPKGQRSAAEIADEILDEETLADAAAAVVDEADADVSAEDVQADVDAAVTAAVEEAIDEIVADIEAEDDGEDDAPADDAARSKKGQRSTAARKAGFSGARAASLIRLATRNGLTADFVARHVEAGTSPAVLREAILDARLARSAAPISSVRARITRDEGDTTRQHAENAVHALLSGTRAKDDDVGRFKDQKLIDIAKRSLGSSASGRSDREIIAMSTRSGMHSSSDFSFANATGGAIERRVRELLKDLKIPLMPLVRETLVSNMLPVNTYSIGGFPELLETAEGAEYKAGTVSTESGSFFISKFGRILMMTFESILNDDMRMLDTSIKGVAAKDVSLRKKKIRDAFGAKLADGKSLFHNSRGNLITTPVGVDALKAARLKLATVKDLDGDPMDLELAYIVCALEDRDEWEKLMSPITAAVTGDVNIYAGRFSLIADPMLAPGEWIAAADPAYGDAIELADLRGYEGVRVEEIPNHLVDGISYRARAFAGAHPTGWRGFVKSTGTGA